jgi:membrane protease YdiL (CAAX protease family)
MLHKRGQLPYIISLISYLIRGNKLTMDEQQHTPNNNDQIPTPLQSTLIIIASFLFALIIIPILFVPFVPQDPNSIENSSIVKLMTVILEFAIIIFPYLYLKRKKFPIKKIFRWNAIDKNIVIVIIAIGLSLSIIGDELDRLIGVFITPPEFLKDFELLMKISSFWDFLLLFLGVVVVASFVEESLFRGLFQVSLEKYQNVTRAVIYSSLAWTIVHGILYWAIQIFLIGIIFGYLAWRTKSIIPSVICHSINNGLALLFNNIDESGFYSFYEWKGHVNPLILIPVIFIMIQGIRFLDKYYLSRISSFEESGSG